MKEGNEHAELMSWYHNTTEQIKYQKGLAWKTTLLYVIFVFALSQAKEMTLSNSILLCLILALFVIIGFVLNKICFNSFKELRKRRKELYDDIYNHFENETIKSVKKKKRNEFSDYLSAEEVEYERCLRIVWGTLSITFFIFLIY